VKVKGEVRDMKMIIGSDKVPMILYMINDDYPRLYRVKHHTTNDKSQ